MYSNGSDPHPTTVYRKCKSAAECLWTFLSGFGLIRVRRSVCSIPAAWYCGGGGGGKGGEWREEADALWGRKWLRVRWREVAVAQTGNSLFLSSYHGWVQPWGPDQRDAPCFHLLQWTLVCIGSFAQIVPTCFLILLLFPENLPRNALVSKWCFLEMKRPSGKSLRHGRAFPASRWWMAFISHFHLLRSLLVIQKFTKTSNH